MKDSTLRASLTQRQTEKRILQGALDPVVAVAQLLNYGYELDSRGDSDGADIFYHRTVEMLEYLHAHRYGGLRVLDLARLTLEHGTRLFQLGKFERARLSFLQALEACETLVQDGVSSDVIELLATTVSWLALAQRQTELLDDALKSYARAQALWELLIKMVSGPERRRKYVRSLAAALLGTAKILKTQGKSRESRKAYARSASAFNRSVQNSKRKRH